MTTLAIISNPASFHAEAQYQRVCAYCEKPGDFHAHHVIPKQRLRKLHLPQYDTRGALRLCEGLDTDHCHMRIEKGIYVLETAQLKQVNICYVWEALGVAGYNLLSESYTGAEARFIAHEFGNCDACQ